jgi:CRISPR-associated protein Csm4
MMSEEVKKKMKDVDFLPCDLFENWIAWQVLGAPEFNAIDQARSQLDDVIEKEQRPRNRIDRVTEQIDLYFCETVNIRESGGLYLLVQTEDDRADALRACLEFLGQELGVGGERKLGLGRFDCDWGELEVEEPDSPTHFLTLSSYFPNPAEQGKLDELVHAYELVRRSGFSGSFSDTGQVKRCSCRMFKEGSVFNEEAKGQLVAVTPANVEVSHPIYRSGLAYTIGVRIEAQS